ncbi:FtsX-like permease family protein [Modestobacter sp. I12A-02628]|uniref:ABC transporter permease n=1 Tax=Goekera deserti TaxID=2497753 RepID=A0A7K3WDC2_9ACTN|nr:ABC transporter permease [Goekera deserti]MPQ96779.1 FtsX-like permease family protein [Goekera deserti]NDI46907.1 FtsX-like permease family protein [Goekera deserti]NEL54475.1 ABC transporter permease [Goekera deserti]
MLAVTLAGIRAHLPRLVASTLAIVTAVGFVVATLTLDQTARDTVLEATAAEYVDASVVVVGEGGTGVGDLVGAVAAVDGVRAVDPSVEIAMTARVPGRAGELGMEVESVADDPALRWQHLTDGALPTGPGQIAVSERVGAAVGDVLQVSTYDTQGVLVTSDLTVTGVVDLGSDATAGRSGRGFVTAQQAQSWGPIDSGELRIAGTAGTDADALAAVVRGSVPDTGVTVRTGAEQAELAARAVLGDTGVLTEALLASAAVAVLVAGLVIANTFAVLLAQRTRDLALLRLVGATARQVRRGVLGEAAVTGLLASALGVLAGVGLAAAVSAIVGATDSAIALSGLSVPPSAVATGLAVGTLTTVIAALPPARAATRVAPLAALRPTDPAPLRSRGGVARLGGGLLLVGSGVALQAIGVASAEFLATLAGVVLSALGGLLLAQRAVPPVVALAGRLVARVGGLPARLAAGNASRDPHRTATTVIALTIGVTLTTAMVVATSSARATAGAGLAARYPTDVIVGAYDAMPESVQQQLATADGVVASTGVIRASVVDPARPDLPVEVDGVDPTQALPVLRSADRTTLPRPGEMVVPTWSLGRLGVQAGDALTLVSGDRSQTFTVVSGEESSFTVTADDLLRLAPDATVQTMWLRLADGIDQIAAVDEIAALAESGLPASEVTGTASERATTDALLDTLLRVGTGLLAVAVLIALIGGGNTLALSVVERRQETGLLRALGLTRGQVRVLLAWEAVLAAGVAAVLGVVAGGAYGLATVSSALAEDGGAVVLAVPWLQVGAIVVVATVAGLLASVAPARRAARTPPVAAVAGG